MSLLSIVLAALVVASNAFAHTIDGVWKHATKPALIEFNLTAGTASVKEHQIHKQNAGLTVIKNILPSTEHEWTGQMFNGYKNEYESVTIQLNGNSLSVFDADNSEVLKLYRD